MTRITVVSRQRLGPLATVLGLSVINETLRRVRDGTATPELVERAQAVVAVLAEDAQP